MDQLVSEVEERLSQVEDQVDRATTALRLFIESSHSRRDELEAELAANVARTSEDALAAIAAAARTRRTRGITVAALLLVAGTVAAGVAVSQSRDRIINAVAAVVAPAVSARVSTGPSTATLAPETIQPAKSSTTPTNHADDPVPAASDDHAIRQQATDAVLGAADVSRFELVGVEFVPGYPAAPEARAQLQWSRSHGFVFTASGLPAAPPNMTEVLWLITTNGPMAIGFVMADASGHATLITSAAPVTSPVTGVRVTLEPSGGSAVPSGTVLLMAR